VRAARGYSRRIAKGKGGTCGPPARYRDKESDDEPVQPTPLEDPPGRPAEIPGGPGGGDIDEPGRGPSEVPPDQT